MKPSFFEFRAGGGSFPGRVKKKTCMNLSGIAAALLPVFFVPALRYVAGKRNPFNPG